MREYPTQIVTEQSREFIQEFRGYNHNLRCANNEFYDVENLSTDDYPVLSTRKPRDYVRALDDPAGMIQTDLNSLLLGGLFTIENNKLCLDGVVVENFPTLIGTGTRQIVQMGANIVIFPDKLYLNTANKYYDVDHNLVFSEWGNLEQNNSPYTALVPTATFTLCKSDGTSYTVDSTGGTAPASPTNGMLWLDNSGDISVLKEWSETYSMWISIPTTYVRISYPGICAGINQYDGIDLANCLVSQLPSTRLEHQIYDLNGSHIVQAVDDQTGTSSYIVITGIIDGTYVQTQSAQSPITVRRETPDMQYVVECSNRLWGCYYGVKNGKTVNELYCSALGDFKNWEKYEGISTDSWRASVGSDGPWTGAIAYQGHPLFFKQDRLHKVYVSAEGAHQIVESECYGVQQFSWRSLQIVNGILYYKANTGICAYDGSTPVMLDDVFNEQFSEATAGQCGNKYYINMLREGPGAIPALFVYDTANGIWHRESTEGYIHQFETKRDYSGEIIYMWVRTTEVVNGVSTTVHKLISTDQHYPDEGNFHWAVESGIQGFESPDYKYTSRYNLRMQMPRGSSCDLYIRYDEETRWRHMGHMAGPGIRPFTLPIRPRRCDHFQWKLDGYGECHIYSLARISEGGSDEKHGYD